MRYLKIMCVFLFLLGCRKGKEKLIIFHAGSLAKPMKELANEFTKLHPGIEIQREATGSRIAALKVSELKREADIVAVSDYLVIEELLMPEYANWYAKFARNRMVIAFTERSKYADEITPDNWYKILTRPGVNYGRSDPDLDPCGYRTLMVWQLAELYYSLYHSEQSEESLYETLDSLCPPKNIRPSEIELLPLLESLALDYAFEYLSIARQHYLKYIELPKEIALSDPTLDSLYAKAEVRVTGKQPGKHSIIHGKSIAYAITIPKNASHPELAIKFIKFVLTTKGQEIMEKNGQPPIVPAAVNDISEVPYELGGMVE